jgi:rSAM/selenodomain-associated transferase 1
MRSTRIVIFAKAPIPGQVKTRLIPALGAEGAAKLAGDMLKTTYRNAARVSVASAELCTAPDASHSDWRDALPANAQTAPQGDGDLGQKLARAAERVVAEGDRVILIGTDCPGLDEARLWDACRELEGHDAVIHPTFDGGYALLGLNRFDPSLFSDIHWSTSSVARETMGRIARLGWTLHIGATLQDIDEPEDLRSLGR